MKICSKCKEKKPLVEFYKNKTKKDGHANRCIGCKKKIQKKYRQDNIDKVRAYERKYYQNNLDKMHASMKKYRKNNPEKYLAQARKRQRSRDVMDRRNKQRKERWKSDKQYRLVGTLRARLQQALKSNDKSANTLALLGCSIDYFKEHLEKQFTLDMNWKNQGKWHVDHTLPCASFDLSDSYQQKQCFHWSNLQPMWAIENMKKGDKELYNRTWIGNFWIDSRKSALTTVCSFTSLSR